MPVDHCPPRDSIRDYAVGKLDDDDSRRLADHFDACPDCQAQLETFDDVDDTLLGGLRKPAEPDPIEAESHLSAALARARAVGDPDAAEELPPTGGRPLGFLPRELGEYQLLERLGQGGMGTVYKALHTKLDRVVALKVLATGRMAEHRAIARFEREMKAIGGLDHPNIVRAFDAREIDGLPVLMMECLEGMDLAKAVRRLGRVPVAEACEIARQTSAALQYAYENGLVHRDVKPSNLMLTPQGTVKLLDLGLARWHLDGSGSEEMTATGQAMGTADYMAPEQVADAHTADIRSDIYSLGCTLYKLITGRVPFAGPDYQGTYEKMTAHVEQPARPIRELAPEVPEPLAQLIDRTLAKSPEARFAMPDEVGRALEPFCNEADLSALAARAEEAEPPLDTDGQSLRTAGSQAIIASSPLAQPGSWFNRRRPILTLLGLLGPLAAALGILIIIQRDGKRTEIEVPERAKVTVTDDGKVVVALDDKSPSSDPGQGRLEQPGDAPPEGAMTRLPTSRIEPPDILEIEMLEAEFKGPYQAETHDVLYVDVDADGGWMDFSGHVTVNAKGTVNVGNCRSVSVAGKSIAEIETAVKKRLLPKQGEQYTVSVQLAKAPRTQQVNGRHLVRPDGTIDLRKYGTIDVAGKTVAEATQSVTDVLAEHFKSPDVSVDVVAYDSKVYYIIATGEGELPDKLTSMPITRKQTARDVIGHIKEPLTRLSKKHLWISRPTGNLPEGNILPIDLAAIIRGNTKTNYQILPNDRLFISHRPHGESLVNHSPDATATTPPDQKTILGTWKVVSNRRGLPKGPYGLLIYGLGLASYPRVDSAEIVKTATVVISDSSVTVRATQIPSRVYDYQINPDTDLKMIDLLRHTHGVLGVYELQDDQLKICLDWRSKRPDSLWADLGSDREVLVLRRVSPVVIQPDERAIQGTWEVVEAHTKIAAPEIGLPSLNAAPRVAPHGEIDAGRKVVISARELTILGVPKEEAVGKTVPPQLQNIIQPLAKDDVFQYVLNPSEQPARIDMTRGRHTNPCPGIYHLDGDRLRIRLAEIRPTKVDGPAVDGEVLLVLKRVRHAAVETPLEPPDPIVEEPTTVTSPPPVPKADIEAVQGTWEVVRSKTLLACFDRSRDDADLEEAIKTTRVVITPDTLKVLGPHVDCRAFEYQINPATKNKIIDLKTDKVCLGIYKLEGDRLTICAGAAASRSSEPKRPTEFWAELGSSKDVLELKRVGDAKIEPDDKAMLDTWHIVSGSGQVRYNPFKSSHERGSLVGETMERRRVEINKRLLDFGYVVVRLAGRSAGVRAYGVYALDSSQTPKSIDFELGGSKLRGIYELQGDQLKIAAGKQRPTRFEPEPDSDQILLVMKRESTIDHRTRLDFRVAAVRGDDGKPGLSEEEIEAYREKLAAGKALFRKREAGQDYAWFWLTSEPNEEWITGNLRGESKGPRCVLLSVKPEDTMLAADTGERQWAVEKATVDKDPSGRPAVLVVFDPAGGQRFGRLTETHLKMPLAILVDDRVLSMPRVMTKINSKVQITGSFDASEAAKMAEALTQGMADDDQPEPEEDDTKPVP